MVANRRSGEERKTVPFSRSGNRSRQGGPAPERQRMRRHSPERRRRMSDAAAEQGIFHPVAGNSRIAAENHHV